MTANAPDSHANTVLRDGQPPMPEVSGLLCHRHPRRAVIARSAQTILLQGNHYFPPGDVNLSVLTPCAITSRFTITTERKCRFSSSSSINVSGQYS